MKFKVGDRVRLVKVNNELNCYKEFLNKSFTIKSFDKDKFGSYAHLEETSDICPYLENLELFEYTYENLKKTPVGTKVTFENGEKLIKSSENRYENESRWREEDDLVKMKDIYGTLGKIIKIEEPTYQTVYEAKKEILDDAEKRYLKQVIRPFRKQGIFITKIKDSNTDKERIVFDFEKDYKQSIFPAFDKNTMYEGMKLYNHYTLEELGLKE